ncbi:MAG: hypothetical protein HOV80_12765 [Polyangiaceae bacterium]|nr:hypothetical protein [Polyangiaceae bacterium]
MNESDDDMTTPITRGELTQAMNRLDAKLELFFGAVMGRFEAIDRRFDEIEHRFTTFRAEVNTRFEAAGAAMNARFDAVDRRFEEMHDELARHTSASAEQLRSDVGAVDDKYNDLPPRVTKLEVAVFPRPPSRRAVAATPKKRRRKAS